MSSRVFGRLKVVRVAQRHHALVHCRVASTKTSNWVHPVHQVDSMQSDKHEPLRTDVRFLGWALGSFIKSRDPATYEEVERLRELAKTCRMAGFGASSLPPPWPKVARAHARATPPPPEGAEFGRSPRSVVTRAPCAWSDVRARLYGASGCEIPRDSSIPCPVMPV